MIDITLVFIGQAYIIQSIFPVQKKNGAEGYLPDASFNAFVPKYEFSGR